MGVWWYPTHAAMRLRHGWGTPVWWDSGGEKRIPCGNDKQKGKGGNRFPAGMTSKKAKATTDSLRE